VQLTEVEQNFQEKIVPNTEQLENQVSFNNLSNKQEQHLLVFNLNSGFG